MHQNVQSSMSIRDSIFGSEGTVRGTQKNIKETQEKEEEAI